MQVLFSISADNRSRKKYFFKIYAIFRLKKLIFYVILTRDRSIENFKRIMAKQAETRPENLNAGHRQRLRQRFNTCGIKALAPHEIIELLLTFAIPQRDVKPLAKSLLQRFPDISTLLAASPELLMEQPGIKENSATLLKLIHALYENLQENNLKSTDLIENPLAAVRYLRTKIGYQSDEVLALIILDNANRVVGCEWRHGEHNRVQFNPRFVARTILRHNGSRVIIGHNHPGGVCIPSEADLEATATLKEFLEKLDLKLVDHLLVTKLTHLSLLNRIGCIFKNYRELDSDPRHSPSGITPIMEE